MADWQSNSRQSWMDWQNKVKGWNPEGIEDNLATRPELEDANAWDRAKALFERMLFDTGGSNTLSRTMVDSLRNRVSRAFVQNALLAGSEYGEVPKDFGGFLKSWMTMGQGGWGNVGNMQGRGQQLLDKLQQGHLQNIQGQEGGLTGLYDWWSNNPSGRNMMVALLGLLSGSGLYGNYMQDKLRESQGRYAVLPDELRAGDWIEYLLGSVPNQGNFKYTGRPQD